MTKAEADTVNPATTEPTADVVPMPPINPPAAKVEIVRDGSCPKCHDTREVFSVTLGKMVRCTECTTIKRPNDSSGLKNLTAAEQRRVNQAARMIDAAIITALRGGKKGAYWIAEPRLRVVDRIMQRWAVGHSNGGPPPENPESRPPGLDDDTQRVIDDLVKDDGPTPERVKYHIFAWYRTETPCHVIGLNLGMSERSVYRYHEVVLDWLEKMFLASQHPTLVRMLRMVEP